MIGDVVDKKDCMRTFVVSVGDCSKTLLTCGIPNLKFDVFVVRGNCFEAKVDSDGGHVVFVELIVCESQEKAAFAD